MNGAGDRVAFWRLWRDLGKAVWAMWMHMQSATPEDSHRKGIRWQDEFRDQCEARRLCWEKPTGREDCQVNGLKVQCKAVDRDKGGIDIANMRPVKANDGVRGYLRNEIDVVALRHKDKVFLIPADVLDRGNGVLKARVRLPEIREFQDCWSVFSTGYVPSQRDRQHVLFARSKP